MRDVLLAEVHGHVSRDLADNEDYLTSAVFGHLRYLRPTVFWSALFSRALGILHSGKEQSLLEFLQCRDIQPSEFTTVDAYFWPNHEVFGTPDLILCFAGIERDPFVLVCEAKLWAGKSGVDGNDQLFRYLKLLSSLGLIRPEISASDGRNATAALLYITPRDSVIEVLETAALCKDDPQLKHLLFRVQWQDITEVADESQRTADRLERLLLSDVAAFLRNRGLEYFRGFRKTDFPARCLPEQGFYNVVTDFAGFEPHRGEFYSNTCGLFYDSKTAWPRSGFGHRALKAEPMKPSSNASSADSKVSTFAGFNSEAQSIGGFTGAFYFKPHSG